jgi:formylmethanofuran--tetrahydromethanopterin N-formyltransferase
MEINGVTIEDTFAEAFKMWGSRLIITAATAQWAMTTAQAATGFGTSIIGCGCEAGIGRVLGSDQTPDGRPGVEVLFFTTSKKSIEPVLLVRVGQCIMTAPTSACFNGLAAEKTVAVGGKLRYFGDGFQSSKLIDGRRVWRVPVMDGEFVIEEDFGMQKSVGGGNFLILAESQTAALEASEQAVAAMRQVPDIIMPFPGGIVRSGSKTSSIYKGMTASTNTAYCPTIRQQVESVLPEGVNSVMEIVIDGLNEEAIAEAMRHGVAAACQPGVVRISAGNYGGTLGQFQFHLNRIMA